MLDLVLRSGKPDDDTAQRGSIQSILNFAVRQRAASQLAAFIVDYYVPGTLFDQYITQQVNQIKPKPSHVAKENQGTFLTHVYRYY
jgi:hypothetical protein